MLVFGRKIAASVALLIPVLYMVLVSTANADAARLEITCQWLGTLPGGGSSAATAVSADGTTIVGYAHDVAGKFRAFRWTRATGLQPLDLGGSETVALATNAEGTVIVGWRTNSGRHGSFRWDLSAGIQPLTSLSDESNRVEDNAFGISSDGSIAVGSHGRALTWRRNAPPVALPSLSTRSSASAANAITADGKTIVGSGVNSQGDQELVRWRARSADDNKADNWSVEALGNPPGSHQASARAVNADGSVVVGDGYDTEGQKAFRWVESRGAQWLKPLVADARANQASAVSADGRVIAGDSYGAPVVWIDGEMPFSLIPHLEGADPNGSAAYAEGVSADGSVVVGDADRRGLPKQAFRCELRKR